MSSRVRTAGGAEFEPRGTLHEHVIAIHDLAHDFSLPEPVVADMYWPELARLQQGATIDVYLPLLTERRVRERLRRSGRPDKAQKDETDARELVTG